MIRPPSVAAAGYFPLTSTLCGAVIIIAIGGLMGANLSPFMMSFDTLWQKPWQLLTSSLYQGGGLQLFFTVYWIWTFGTFIEHLVSWRGWLCLYFPATIACASIELALYGGGYSLIGVVYAFFGFLWVLSRRVHSVYNAIDAFTVKLFLCFFVLSYALKMLKIVDVHVISSVTGLIIGLVIGLAFSSKTALRAAAVLGACVCVAAPLYYAHQENQRYKTAYIAMRREMDTLNAIAKKDYAKATEITSKALQSSPQDIPAIVSNAVAYAGQGMAELAIQSLQKAKSLIDQDEFGRSAGMVANTAAESPYCIFSGELIEYAKKHGPDEVQTLFASAEYNRRLGYPSLAIRELDKLITSDAAPIVKEMATTKIRRLRTRWR